MDFLSQRYIASVEFVFSNIVIPEDLQFAMKIILQHCMPPTSVRGLKKLFSILASADIDSNWCVKCERIPIHNLINALPSENHNEEEEEKFAQTYPLFFGIDKINKLRDRGWSTKDVRFCIDVFISRVYALTEEPHLLSTAHNYYRDVLATRDDVISDYAHKNELSTYSQTNEGPNKIELAFKINSKQKLIGGDVRQLEETPKKFWDNPPEIEIKPRPSKQKSTNDTSDETKDIENIDTNPFGFLDTNSQALFKRSFIKDFSKQNVRTFSDRNQLSREIISQYIAYTADKNKLRIFTVALIRAALGIEQKRLFYPEKNQDHKSWVIQFHEKHTISYTVSNGATDFARSKGKEPSQAAHITIKLPETLYTLLQKLFYSGENFIDQSPIQKSFKLKFAGPAPTLDRIARSSHLVYRSRFLDENSSFILGGNIPVQLRASNSYIATRNAFLASKFLCILNRILDDVCKVTDNILVQKIKQETSKLITNKALKFPGYSVGSQLATQSSFSFHEACAHHLNTLTLSTVASRAEQVEGALEILSQHETYYYFMLQFANAARAVGPNTILNETGAHALYREKSSKHFSEYKFISTLKLVNQQRNQLLQMREHVFLFIKNLGYLLGGLFDTGLALKYEANHRKEIIKIDILNGKVAHRTALAWGYTPNFSRTNNPRHICSSSQFLCANPSIRDAWLGHHIDGYAPTAPGSSGNIRNLFESLDQIRDKFVSEHEFKLLKSEPLYGTP